MKVRIRMLALTLGMISTTTMAVDATVQVPTSQKVTPPAITLRVDHGLVFADVQEGAPQAVLPPTDANAADVAILNGRGRTASTSVVESSINLDDGAGHTIAVSSFVGSPGFGTITLPASGEQHVKIGATRAALTTQPAGDYAGTFTFKVVY